MTARRNWIAPQIARIALVHEPAVYKLYAIVDETRLTSSQAMVECEDFISQLLPMLDTAIGGSGDEPAAASPAAEGNLPETPAAGEPEPAAGG